MTNELKQIVNAFTAANAKGLKTVLATVVALEGSSYRRPGVRMLLIEGGNSIGAVSGGCVEKEVFRQAKSVFESAAPKVMTYDGRYRLGCEGVLYVLLEPFRPGAIFLEKFKETIAKRTDFSIQSYFRKEHMEDAGFGSVFILGNSIVPLRPNFEKKNEVLVFEQKLTPCFKLIIIGAEHDAVQLCSYATITGWEVTIVAAPKEEKSITDFPGATTFSSSEAEDLVLAIDERTAIVLMTHSYAKDLQFLAALKNIEPIYFGLLGPARRREKLFNELLERFPDITEEFLDSVHGPAGLDIGAETPQEISLAIMSEILSVSNKRKPILLKDRKGKIHS